MSTATITSVQSRIEGEFNGFNGGAIFRLSNGQVWQQKRYRYRYKYAYRPQVILYKEDGRYFLNVPCMDEAIEVVRVNILCEGVIVSDFKGFNGDAKFSFQNGLKWKQAEYKYSYHYAYRPEAIVIDGIEGVTLHVDGMSDVVRVHQIY